MTILLPLLLLLHVATVASFTPTLLYHHHPCHHTLKDHDSTKRIFFSNAAPAPQYSLTVEDWHTASQLHPLDNLGVIDDESSSAIMMMGRTVDTAPHTAGSSTIRASVSTASHPSKMGAGEDMIREFIEAFFPVILLILLEIYSQQILQFPLA